MEYHLAINRTNQITIIWVDRKNIMLNKRNYILYFLLYEVLEQEKLNCSDRNQTNGCLGSSGELTVRVTS